MAKTIVASHTLPGKTYTVCLTTNQCDCPDFLHRRAPGCGHAQEGTDCKHIKQARRERHEHLVMIAGTLETPELERLVAKYAALPGKGEVVFAMLCELQDRELLTKPVVDLPPAEEVTPAPVPAHVAAVIAKATAKPTERELRAIFA